MQEDSSQGNHAESQAFDVSVEIAETEDESHPSLGLELLGVEFLSLMMMKGLL